MRVNINIPAGQDRIGYAEFRERMLASGVPASKFISPPLQKERKGVVSEIPTEHEEQSDLVSWLRLKGIRHNSTPLGGHRAIKTAKKLRAEGSSPGFPDITIWPEAGSCLPIVFIEMKRTKKGTVSEYQSEWLDYLSCLGNEGYPVRSFVAKGFQEAIKMLEEIGYGL